MLYRAEVTGRILICPRWWNAKAVLGGMEEWAALNFYDRNPAPASGNICCG